MQVNAMLVFEVDMGSGDNNGQVMCVMCVCVHAYFMPCLRYRMPCTWAAPVKNPPAFDY